VNQRSNCPLLAADEPPPVEIVNHLGRSPFLLIGDHAGNAIPGKLGNLGLGPENLRRHIAWDIGIASLGYRLAELLGAAFIRQHYSRLVIDCNRDPRAEASIVTVSDGTRIPGNQKIETEARRSRIEEIYRPYQDAIAAELARRDAAGEDSILVALHSFTPQMGSSPRPWQIGILHAGAADGFARRLLARLRRNGELNVGDNQPYQMDGTDFTIPFHAFPTRRPYAELEIRQDLLMDDEGVEKWSALVAEALLAEMVSA
jgi:predicted N-formylglutamate amidohydrolase